MGGWSGGVYTRFRNWVTDKANSINPQASLFDQEDDGFAAGLNNCVTKDGLNKPSSAMDWNGQNLSGVLNLTVTGTASVAGNATLGSGGSTTALTFGNATSNPTYTFNGSSLALFNGPIEVSLNGKPLYVLNSSGANFGLLQNDSLGVWSLAYGSSITALGTPVLQWNASNQSFARDDGGTMQSIGWRDIPVNARSADYTLALSDRGKFIVNNKAGSAMALAIPTNASVAFPVGTGISGFNNVGGQNIQVQRSGGVSMFLAGDSTFTNSDRIVSPGGQFTIVQYAANTWIISGSGVS